jgi:hypothetical protein
VSSRDEDALKLLQERRKDSTLRLARNAPVFMMYLDTKEFGLIHILSYESNQQFQSYELHFTLAKPLSRWGFESLELTVDRGTVEQFTSPHALRNYLDSKLGLSQQILPKG